MKLKNNKKGFTLLEIIFALAVLVIGIVGVIALFPVGLRASKRGGDFTIATLLAQRQLNMIKRAGQAVYNPYDGDWPDYGEDYDESNYSHFTKWYALFSQPTIGITKLYTVDLKVYWNDRGNERYEEFITYLADYQ